MSNPQNIRYARWAVIAFFSSNGFIYANWIARLPEIETFYDIGHSQLGIILLTSAVGSIVAMPVAGYLNNLYGSRRITIISAVLLTLIVSGLVITPSMFVVYAVAFSLGITSGSMDVSMNGQAVIIERQWGKSIMSSFHATFSIGMVLGAGVGALAAELEFYFSTIFWQRQL